MFLTQRIEEWTSSTSIAKAKLNTKELKFKNIFQAEPPIDSGYHFGSRLVIKDSFFLHLLEKEEKV